MSGMTKAMLEQHAARLMVQCAEQQARIRELEGELVEKDSRITHLDALTDLSGKYGGQMLAKIQELEDRLTERPRERSRSPRRPVENAMEGLRATIQSLEATVQAKDEAIQQIENTLREMESRVIALEKQLAGANERLDIKQSTIDNILGMLDRL